MKQSGRRPYIQYIILVSRFGRAARTRLFGLIKTRKMGAPPPGFFPSLFTVLPPCEIYDNVKRKSVKNSNSGKIRGPFLKPLVIDRQRESIRPLLF